VRTCLKRDVHGRVAIHINWGKPNLNRQVRDVGVALELWAQHSSNTLCLAQICNSCHLIIINYVCFVLLLQSPNGSVFKYFVTDDGYATSKHVLKFKKVIIFLKITICFLLSRPFNTTLKLK